MDDGKRKNLELIRSITTLIGLFLLVAPANGTPKKMEVTPAPKSQAQTRNQLLSPKARP